MLMSIQNDLFDLGADLATPDTGTPPEYEPLRIIESQVTRIRKRHRQAERRSAAARDPSCCRAALTARDPPASGPHHHTPCRRLMVTLSRSEDEIVSASGVEIRQPPLRFLFVAARHANDRGRQDVLWVPGKNR